MSSSIAIHSLQSVVGVALMLARVGGVRARWKKSWSSDFSPGGPLSLLLTAGD
ncbi:hypothetical protein GE21DRAFT_1293585 [Neurospora crassa]|nr:hypothetical protein GE21DRAFT_1293585 [Neurospora crassa]